MNSAMLSSQRMDWQTPENVLQLVRQVGPIGLDVCTTADNPVRARRFITRGALDHKGEWARWVQPGESAWMNPPYGSELPDWLREFALCGLDGGRTHWMALVPSRTETAWFRSAWRVAQGVCCWKGRLRFRGAPASAPFPSAIFYFGPEPYRFGAAFQSAGLIVLPGGGR